ncbi:hypothetical protein [uncultured Clostridium sp.]|uniref:hypothetical protein n=1 Tax=uncultured Clostridium sp. TaxID=59620 RepID=UPI0025E13C36|nr:hypothetical protein [uncultured Clostridium sp.]
MEVFLEQFIACDKDKQSFKNVKIITIAVILLGLFIFFFVWPIIALVIQIAALIFFVVTYFSFVDYEYELYNGNIDISKIYAGSKRKTAQKIIIEDVESVYESSNNIDKKQALFNNNIKGLKVYTFKLKGNKLVQLALNEELEKIVKIVYRRKIEIR